MLREWNRRRPEWDAVSLSDSRWRLSNSDNALHWLPLYTSSAALINTHLNASYRGKMKRKRHVNFSENSQFPSETHSYKMQWFLCFAHRELWSCSACGIFSSLLLSSASLASVNGCLQTNYNNNGIFPLKCILQKWLQCSLWARNRICFK